jgi:hypothetical protein
MRTIAWDVDDVLNDLMRVWLETHWRPGHPGADVVYGRIVENPPHRLLGVDPKVYLDSLDDFRLSGHYQEMLPLPQVHAWFLEHGDDHRHIAVTSVPMKAASVSAAWVQAHFGRWIRTFHVVPSPREGDGHKAYDRNKVEAIRSLGGADLFIDDMPGNLTGCEQAGMRGLVFPRPWNKSTQGIEDLLRSLTEASSAEHGCQEDI